MSTSWMILFTAICAWTSFIPVTGHMEKKLIADLLASYSKYARPVHNNSDVVKVHYEITYTMIDVDEVENTQTLTAFETLIWNDEFLVWDRDLYGGIDELRIDSNSIWTPDMTPYNTIHEVDAERGQGVQNIAAVHFRGLIILLKIMKTKVLCDFDTHYFPFDSANCSLVMGPWVYATKHMNLTLRTPEVDLVYLQIHPRWNLVNATVEILHKTYPCCPEVYQTIAYKNKFVRVSNDYVLALLVPSFLLSILTILLFLLPNYSSEKITLGILLFCAFFMILVYTYSVLPSTRTTPYFVVFLTFNLIMLSLVNFLNGFVVNLSNYEFCQEVPKILQSIVLEFIAKRLCMTSIVNRNRSRHILAAEHDFKSEKTNFYKLSVSSDKQPLDPPTDDQANDELLNANSGLKSDIAFIGAFTRSYWQKTEDGEAEKRFRQGWRDVGRVINRFFCIIYIVVVLMAVGVNIIQISSK